MKLGTALVLFFALTVDSVAFATDIDQQIAASRAAAKTFGMNLKAELQAALKEGGPTNGVAVCSERAAEIAENTSKELGLHIGRTSLKVRNPDNAADDWEHDVLNRFEEQKAAGEPLNSLEFYEVIDADGTETFRYMKAIPTAEVCLACHGSELTPELAAKLEELYPEDQARGFEEGDIRGAFTVSQPL